MARAQGTTAAGDPGRGQPLFGNRAYSEALARARHEDEHDRDPSHWFAVRREIARQGVETVLGWKRATRYVGS